MASERFEIIPKQVYVTRHIELKYACRCCDKTNIIKANKPLELIPKGIASHSLLAYIGVSKYLDSLPLYRLETILSRAGGDINRTSMARWMIKLSEAIQPLINLMKDDLCSSPIIHCDETGIQVLKEPDRAASSKSFMWVLARGDPGVCIFEYHSSRSSQTARSVLGDYKGHMMVDGYRGYNNLGSDIVRIGCWAHARRYFYNAKSQLGPKAFKGSLAEHGLKKVKALYAVEKKSKYKSAEERLIFRKENSVPILNELRTWLEKNINSVPKSLATGKALNYLFDNWDYLSRYTEAGYLPLDNNFVERMIRNYAIGRKNWIFSDTPAGADASANIYSLLTTARLNNLQPYEYLRGVLDKIPYAKTIEDYQKLLPYKIK